MKNILNRAGKLIKLNNEAGIILITVLLMCVILLMVGTAIIITNQQNRGFSSTLESQEQALKVAEAGVSYAIYQLTLNPSWGKDSDDGVIVEMYDVNGNFEITFDNKRDYFSTNFLDREFYTPEGNDDIWDKAGIPRCSVDLIVTGTIENGNQKTIKRLRVLLQRDATFGAALTTGKLSVKAKTMDITKEPSMKNPSTAGTIHSNSVKESPDFAIFTKFGVTEATQILLHGGTVSAQGDIDITDANLDDEAGSTVDPVKQSRNIAPIDIEKTLEEAKTRLGPGLAGDTFIISKDSVTPAIPGATVVDGKLYIQSDVIFSGDVRFEFDYASLTGDVDDSDLEKRNIIKQAGVYLENLSDDTVQPSLYVDGGDLTIAGPVRGNGAVYSSGKASFIGEANLIAPADPGVVILSEGDLNMELPSVSKTPLELDFTGLVYTHGNANIEILDPEDPVNPANNFSGGQWPPDWENMYLGVRELPFNQLSNVTSIANPSITYGSQEVYYGDYVWTFPSTDKAKIIEYGPGDYGIAMPNNETGIEVPCEVEEEDDWGSSEWKKVGDGKLKPTPPPDPADAGELIIIDIEDSSIGNTGDLILALNDIFASYNMPPPGAGEKVDPNFHITGALVAIDPDNPIPAISGIDDGPDAGNANIDINKYSVEEDEPGGNLFIKHSSKYLKLLQTSKAYTSYKWLYWSEI